MAKIVDNPEERDRRILLVRDYVLDQIQKGEKFSTRSIAAYFTDNNYFSISNNTVDTYLKKLNTIDPKSYQEINKHLQANKPRTINDANIRNRIEKVANLVLMGYKVTEIAELLGETKDTIIRDLDTRLTKISNKEELEQIKSVLKENSLKNLHNHQTK